MRLIGRLALVAVAIVAATLAAFTALIVLGAGLLDAVVEAGPDPWFMGDYLAVLFLLEPGLVIGAAIALLAVVVGEIVPIRSWIYYVLAAGAALAATPVIVASPGLPHPDLLTLCASAGFVGGFVYWLLAGRRA